MHKQKIGIIITLQTISFANDKDVWAGSRQRADIRISAEYNFRFNQSEYAVSLIVTWSDLIGCSFHLIKIPCNNFCREFLFYK